MPPRPREVGATHALATTRMPQCHLLCAICYETLLLHGTKYANTGPIAVQGFDDSLAGRELYAPSIVEQALALPLDVIWGGGPLDVGFAGADVADVGAFRVIPPEITCRPL